MLDTKYDTATVEPRIAAAWDKAEAFKAGAGSKPGADPYCIVIPPPNVTGSLHMGHVFSYTHTDIVARFQRMSGKAVFYPMGWDDNGLPTERRVQNFYGVSCDPSLKYVAGFEPPFRN